MHIALWLLCSVAVGAVAWPVTVQYVREGGRVELECEGGGGEGEGWRRGDIELQNSSQYTILPGQLLVIMNITADITGHNQSYSCGNRSTILIISQDQAVTMATVAPTGSDSIKAIVVASIIGSCAVVVLTVLSVCGLLYCLYQLQGQGVDPMEYDIEEEYEARIDSQALARLEPDVRSKIDPSFLGKIAHTNPRVLAEFTQSPAEETMEFDFSLSKSLGFPSSPYSPQHSILSHQPSIHRSHSATNLTTVTSPESPPHTPHSYTSASYNPFLDPSQLQRANTWSDLTSSVGVTEGRFMEDIEVVASQDDIVRFVKRTTVTNSNNKRPSIVSHHVKRPSMTSLKSENTFPEVSHFMSSITVMEEEGADSAEEETVQPAKEASVTPDNKTPVTSQSTSATSQSTSATSQSTSATSESTSATSESTSATSESTSAPSQSTPAPSKSTPAPSQSTSGTSESTSVTSENTSATSQKNE